MVESIILNPYAKQLEWDRSVILVVALDYCKKWFPLAKKLGNYESLELFQDVVLTRLLRTSQIDFYKLEGYVKHLAKVNASRPSEVLIEDFELLDKEIDFSPSRVQVNKGVESFWFNWLESLKVKPLKPLKNEEELVYLLKSVLILRFMESKGMTEQAFLSEGESFRYRTWWSHFIVSLVGRVGLSAEGVKKRISTWLSYYLQCEKVLTESSILYLKSENLLLKAGFCYEKQPTKTRAKGNTFTVVGENSYTIYKVDIQSYIDFLFDKYFEEGTRNSFRLVLGSQEFYNIPYLGYVLGGDLETLCLEALAGKLVQQLDCRFIGVSGSTMYLELNHDGGDFPVFLVYFKEIFQFDLESCGKFVELED